MTLISGIGIMGKGIGIYQRTIKNPELSENCRNPIKNKYTHFPLLGMLVLFPKVIWVVGVVLNRNWRADGRKPPISVLLSPFQSPFTGRSPLIPKYIFTSNTPFPS